MAKLPIVSGTEAVKALQRLGFFVDRQRGSHVVLKKVTPHHKANGAALFQCTGRLPLALFEAHSKWQASRRRNLKMFCDYE